ncbi:uncharacterized protein [Onthophagus taurus]|uniref:uncharacterized protein n=1 Tax=Onthophagus taurus TaxID=166361 RepID=UPI0039BE4E3E
MRHLIISVLFVFTLTAEHKKKPQKQENDQKTIDIKIQMLEQQGLEGMQPDVYDSIMEAFGNKAIRPDGKMQLVVAFLKNKNTTKSLEWVAAVNPEGFFHSSLNYAYFKVDTKSSNNTVKIAGFKIKINEKKKFKQLKKDFKQVNKKLLNNNKQ